MSSANTPATIFAPLTSAHDLVELIQRVSGEPRKTVIRRLLAETRIIGANVRQDAKSDGLTPYEWSDTLIEFYATTKSYLYDSAAWNRCPLKMEMRSWIGAFLRRHNLKKVRVLTYGDGLGFDSTYLSMHGCDVTYFEPSEDCARFARHVFEANNVNVRHIATPEELSDSSFDLIVCLDVLEHVPEPPQTVMQFSRWLKPDGYLITHSPFFFIEPYHPTHLRSNMKYSGSVSLFRQHGLQPYDGNLFWDPIVVKKSRPNPAGRRLTKVRLGQPLLTIGRWLPQIHCFVARMKLKGDSRWISELEALERDDTAL